MTLTTSSTGTMVVNEIAAPLRSIRLEGGVIKFTAGFAAEDISRSLGVQTVAVFGPDGELVGSGRLDVGVECPLGAHDIVLLRLNLSLKGKEIDR